MGTALITLAAIVIPYVQNPLDHSVQFYDNQIQVTQRVLDQSIYEDIRRVQTISFSQAGSGVGLLDSLKSIADARIKRHIKAVNQHCIERLKVEAINTVPCGIGTRG